MLLNATMTISSRVKLTGMPKVDRGVKEGFRAVV